MEWDLRFFQTVCDSPGPTKRLHIDLLSVCRQTYMESVRFLWVTNKWSAGNAQKIPRMVLAAECPSEIIDEKIPHGKRRGTAPPSSLDHLQLRHA